MVATCRDGRAYADQAANPLERLQDAGQRDDFAARQDLQDAAKKDGPARQDLAAASAGQDVGRSDDHPTAVDHDYRLAEGHDFRQAADRDSHSASVAAADLRAGAAQLQRDAQNQADARELVGPAVLQDVKKDADRVRLVAPAARPPAATADHGVRPASVWVPM